MADKPRTKASYAKPMPIVPFKTPIPLTNQYSALASSSQSYSQATQKISSEKPSSIRPNLVRLPGPIRPNTIPELCRPNSFKLSPQNSYIPKTCSITVKILDEDELNKDQTPNLSKIFPSVNGKIIHYWPRGYQTPPKTQEYYEFILVDTDSVEITHVPETNSESIAYSKCKIRKIITKEEWGNPYQPRTFSQNFQPLKYNYFDYQEAWSRTFYVKPTNHSWYFNFCKKFNKKIPNWAHSWWVYFGLTKEILPAEVQKSWDYFHENLKKPFYGNKAIMFTAEFQVPWIISWDFAVTSSLDYQYPPVLERRFRAKWWKNFQAGERLTINNIRLWLITYDKIGQFPKPHQNATTVNRTPTKRELKNKLLEELSQLGEDSDEEDISSSKPEPARLLFQDSQDPYEGYDSM